MSRGGPWAKVLETAGMALLRGEPADLSFNSLARCGRQGKGRSGSSSIRGPCLSQRVYISIFYFVCSSRFSP